MIPNAGRDQCAQAADPCNTMVPWPQLRFSLRIVY
jgi:hypothetical protein